MNTFQLFFFTLILLLFSCSNPVQGVEMKENRNDSTQLNAIIYKDTIPQNSQSKDSIVQKNNGNDTLVVVDMFNKKIMWELKYATSENFMKRILYDTLNKVYVQKVVAIRLAKCQDYLDKIHPGYHLLVYDGVRPLSVQWEMWNALDTIPVNERGKFVSNPANGSVHNYGAAVDITICDSKKNPLDMGAGYDDIRKIAYPSLENEFLKSGELSLEQVNNRKLLRKVMESQGFLNIPSEWWHFNAYPRHVAKSKFQLVKNEF